MIAFVFFSVRRYGWDSTHVVWVFVRIAPSKAQIKIGPVSKSNQRWSFDDVNCLLIYQNNSICTSSVRCKLLHVTIYFLLLILVLRYSFLSNIIFKIFNSGLFLTSCYFYSFQVPISCFWFSLLNIISRSWITSHFYFSFFVSSTYFSFFFDFFSFFRFFFLFLASIEWRKNWRTDVVPPPKTPTQDSRDNVWSRYHLLPRWYLGTLLL